MRIALMLTSLGMGGAERQVVQLGERLRARGHTVLLVTLMPPLAEEWSTELETVRLGMTKSPLRAAGALLEGRRVLRAFGAEILHSHTKHANLAARLLRMAGSRARVVTTLHSVQDGGMGRLLLYRATDGLAARTVAVSRAVAESYIRAGATPAHKCAVIRNAIDTELFQPVRERRAALRAAMGAGERFVWLAAGRATEAKDYPNLMRAFAAVAAAEPEAELWVAGEGTERLALEMGPRVRLLGLRRDVPALLDAADGFVLSSAWEGMPLAVGEALAMEKPVTATRAGGVEELAGEGAELAPVRDAGALAEAMLRTMRLSAAERAARGRRARERMVAEFGWEACLGRWEQLYGAVLRG